MPQARDSPPHHHDPGKIWKSLVLPAAGDFLLFFMKAALLVCIAASICLVSYFGFSAHSRRLLCPGFHTEFKSSVRRDEGPAQGSLTDAGGDVRDEAKTNVSHILFGIGGSSSTWHHRRYYCELWWRPNVTRGYVWLDQAPAANETWPQTSPPYRVSADTSGFRYTSWYGNRSAIRIARIVKESFELGLGDVRWFVMGDDDTVFFVENLVRVLRKYDHREMYYIGGNSESVEQDVVHSYFMAYGGGGFAISHPLAVELVRVLDACINRYHSMYGSDQKIQACMDEIGVPVTKELGFHQLDIRGDPYGLLAAHPAAPLVSLHHLDYLQPIFPRTWQVESVRRLMRVHEADPGRTLQHSFCYDLRRNWTAYVAWGYTAQLYPWLETAKVLETPIQTFVTWKGGLKPFTFNTRPLPADPCARPLIYLLDRVETTGSPGPGSITTTTYQRSGPARAETCRQWNYGPALRVESFVVSAPGLEPSHWEKAPRRQCCRIMDGGQDPGWVIRVEISGCRPQETVTL